MTGRPRRASMPCRCPGICNQVTWIGRVGLGRGHGKGVPGHVRPSWDSKTYILSYPLSISPVGEHVSPRRKTVRIHTDLLHLCRKGYTYGMFLLSSAEERSAVNRMVAGSIPAVGVPHVCKRTGDSVAPCGPFSFSHGV